MKHFIFLITVLSLSRVCIAQDTLQNRIVFDYLIQTKDSMEVGSNILFNFPFTNIGDTPLFLTKVRSSCGCLVPHWPKEAIEPRESAEILVKYDSRRIGPINKTITVEINDFDIPIVLRVKGSVYAEE